MTCASLAGVRLYLILPSTFLSNLNSIPSVLRSFAISLRLVPSFIADTGSALPVIYLFKLSITLLNHSNNSFTFNKKGLLGVVSYSLLKCLDNACVTISRSLSVSLKFLVVLLYASSICWANSGKVLTDSSNKPLNNSSFSILIASIKGCNISSIAISSVTLPLIKYAVPST